MPASFRFVEVKDNDGNKVLVNPGNVTCIIEGKQGTGENEVVISNIYFTGDPDPLIVEQPAADTLKLLNTVAI
jgi:hypothetical protein